MANQSSESRPGKTPAAKRPEDSRHPFPACESALDGLFRQALDRVAAQTNTEPLPTGLEERLMERAAGQGSVQQPAANRRLVRGATGGCVRRAPTGLAHAALGVGSVGCHGRRCLFSRFGASAGAASDFRTAGTSRFHPRVGSTARAIA
ncbi:MAG: hypothetical protein U5J83_05980 [Bryobacterales bacterium]|nr:hypothetical protein [Bryobacterales bacterium]